MQRLLRFLNDPARDAPTGIAGGLRREVVLLGVDDDRVPEDVARFPVTDRPELRLHREGGLPLRIGYEVSDVPVVERRVPPLAVVFGRRVPVPPCRRGIVRRASALVVKVDPG